MSPCRYNPNPVMKEDKNYPEALSGYGGNILLVGIAYDREAKGKNPRHSCVIEKAVGDSGK